MGPAEVVYYNATIHTMDDDSSTAEALLVRGDRIAAVGSREEIVAAAGLGARHLSLDGQTVIPGFNDCHCHILGLGLNLEQIDVTADAVKSVGDIQRAVAERSMQTAPGQWVLGRGYDQNMLAERRHPLRHDLDSAAPNHPAVIWHTSGHVLTCNSAALQRAGITAETTDPAGGQIDRDEHGEPTGLLKESAMGLMAVVIPPPSDEQGVEAIVRAVDLMASFGITSATDASTGHGPSIEIELDMYRHATLSGRLSGRISLLPQIMYVAPPGEETVHAPEEFDVGDQPDWLSISGTKVFSDGALSTRTAAMREPYSEDATNFGILLWEQSTLTDMMRRAHLAGWQIATHALGDRAVEMVLHCYEQAVAGSSDRDRRHRIEHCMVCDDALGRRIRALGIVPVLQPDIFRLGDGYITALGLERAQDLIPMRVFASLGIPVAFSSDAPVVPVDPLQNIRSAMERKTPGGVTLGRQHAVAAMESFRLYTSGGAYATHTEGDKGMLGPRMLADFAVLSRDPALTPVEEFDDVHVTMTVVGGRIVYAS